MSAERRASIMQHLEDHGCRQLYGSTAIAIYGHDHYPGLQIRIGTTHLVVARSGREQYRGLVNQVDLNRAFRDYPRLLDENSNTGE